WAVVAARYVTVQIPLRLGLLVVTAAACYGWVPSWGVVGDPYEALAPGAIRNPLRPFFRWWFTRELHRHVRHACAAAYVTRRTLQERYPCAGRAVCCSDVQIPQSGFVPVPRRPRPGATAFTLVMVGSLEQLYKAPHVLIDAVAQCVRGGLD